MAVEILLTIFAFILGSIPFGKVIAGMKGIDLKKVGSGNIGATNVLRSVGKTPAILTLVGDIMKGTVAVLAAKYIVHDPLVEGIVGLSAVAGHNYSIFLRFQGGKGVATSIGVLLAYSPVVALITGVLWLAVAIATRYSSLGALISFAILPLTMYVADHTREKVFISAIMTILLIIKHTANIKRLLIGTEPKIGEKA